MAEEILDVISESNSLPVIPESDSLILLPDRKSASLVQESGSNPVILEKTEPKVGHARRFSTGNVDIPYTRVKILSRYLATSTGSCHDHCKYGTRDNLDTKTRNPTVKRITEMQAKGQDIKKIETSVERKKKLAANFTPSPGSKILKPNIPIASKRGIPLLSKKGIVLAKQLSLPTNAINVTATCAISPKLKPVQSKPSSLPIKGPSSSKDGNETEEKTETGPALMKSNTASSSSPKSGFRSRSVSLSALHSVKKALMRPLASLSRKRSLKGVSSMNTEKIKKSEFVSYPKNQSSDSKAEPEQVISEDVPEKTLHVIELNPKNKILKDAENGIHNVRLAPTSAKKNLRRAQTAIQATEQPPSSKNKSTRPTKDGTRVIRSSLSSLASFASSKSTRGGDPEKCEGEKGDNALSSKEDSKARQRNSGASNSKDKDSPTRKLAFRTGKVVELKSEISTPRRLKFRRRSHSDILSGKVSCPNANLRSAEVTDGESNVTETDSEKVVLRHQDVEAKKAGQLLLNDMIEKTASKLVKSRKSKVKALVGAFETVISHQDSKSSSTLDAS